MKSKLLSCFRRRLTAPGVLLGCALLFCASAGAQNLLMNGDFETPIDPWDPGMQLGGKTNWTLVYVSGGPGDFAIHDRTIMASRHCAPAGVYCGHGLHFRPRTDWWCHAYFTQTVSGLTPGSTNVVSGYINRLYALAALDIYFEVVGDTTNSVHTPVAKTGWVQYSVTNTASSSGKLEVRLHLNKNSTVWAPLPGYEKYWTTDALFDDFTMTAQ